MRNKPVSQAFPTQVSFGHGLHLSNRKQVGQMLIVLSGPLQIPNSMLPLMVVHSPTMSAKMLVGTRRAWAIQPLACSILYVRKKYKQCKIYYLSHLKYKIWFIKYICNIVLLLPPSITFFFLKFVTVPLSGFLICSLQQLSVHDCDSWIPLVSRSTQCFLA